MPTMENAATTRRLPLELPLNLLSSLAAIFDTAYQQIPDTNPPKFHTRYDSFSDRTGLRAGRNTRRFLLQTYLRDTGEVLYDMSVPIQVNNRHWGGFRLGYRRGD